MFPYRPRKPTLSSKLKQIRQREADARETAAAPAASAASSEAASALPSACASPSTKKTAAKKRNPLDDLRDGGAVERAIRTDLTSLKARFDAEVAAAATSTSSGTTTRQHDTVGDKFRLFKGVYGAAKFGIIHTRCIPPRCDRAEYAQLIYSACLGMLRDALADRVAGITGISRNSINSIDERNRQKTMDGAFALFVLYTLYETCPLPDLPPLYPASASTRAPLAAEGTAASLPSAVFSDCEQAALTTLPLGLTGAGEHSRVIYRRAYKSPIRVGREDYARFVQMQELCLERKAHCERCWAESIEKEEGSWVCGCGIANDCLEIVDRLHRNHSLDYCEYSGPVSLEGFAGSKEYYEKVIDSMAHASNQASEVAAINFAQFQWFNSSINIASGLDIPGLQSSLSQYRKAIDSINIQLPPHTAQSVPGRKSSNQDTQIYNAIRPVLVRSAREKKATDGKRSFIDRLEAMVGSFQHGERLPSQLLRALEDVSEDDEAPQVGRKSRSIWEQAENHGESPDATDVNGDCIAGKDEVIESETDTRANTHPKESTAVRFKFPQGVSQSLEGGIRSALSNIGDDITNDGNTSVSGGTAIAVGGGDAHNFIDVSMELLNQEDLGDDMVNEMNHNETETIATQHTDFSAAPPPSNAAAALQDLLAYANDSGEEGSDEDGEEVSMVTAPSMDGAGQKTIDDLLTTAKSSIPSTKSRSKEKRKKSAPKKAARTAPKRPTPQKDIEQKRTAGAEGAPAGTKERKQRVRRKNARGPGKSRRNDGDADMVSVISTPSAAGGGEDALADLLATAASSREEAKGQRRQRKEDNKELTMRGR